MILRVYFFINANLYFIMLIDKKKGIKKKNKMTKKEAKKVQNITLRALVGIHIMLGWPGPN